jgi:hypothetical protein
LPPWQTLYEVRDIQASSLDEVTDMGRSSPCDRQLAGVGLPAHSEIKLRKKEQERKLWENTRIFVERVLPDVDEDTREQIIQKVYKAMHRTIMIHKKNERKT